MTNPVVQWEICARDAEPARAFYAGLFGWWVDPLNQWGWAGVDTASIRGIPGGISQTTDRQRVQMYVHVDDIEATLAAAEQRRARTVVKPWRVSADSSLAVFEDPEGNRIGLLSSSAGA